MKDTTLPDLIRTVLEDDARFSRVTEEMEGVFGVEYQGVAYSVTVTETE